MADEIQIPLESELLTVEGGRCNASWYRIFARIASAFNAATRTLADTATGLDTKAAKAQTFPASWYWPTATAKDYLLIVNSPIAFTIDEITTKSEGGTATLTGKINGVALGGTANSVSTSEQTQAHTTANAVAVGDDFVLAPSSLSSLVGMTATLKITRTLA